MQKHTTYPVKERNQLLADFFIYHGFKNIKLIGDENQPKLIVDNLSISGFVKNKIYHFTTKQFGGEIIYSVNLNEKEIESTEYLVKIIESAERKTVYRLVVDSIKNLFYVRTDKGAPYFSTSESRYYFDLEKAISTKAYLIEKHDILVKIV